MIQKNKIPIVILFSLCILLSGCRQGSTDAGIINHPDIVSITDYTEWYEDIENTGVYNYVKWIELDVWFIDRIDKYDWEDISFEVTYEGQVIASDLDVSIDMNYMRCFYSSSNDGAILTENGYLAPGLYEISLKDVDGDSIISSSCTVTTESGDVLSEMVTGAECIVDQNNQLDYRIFFKGDITPYSNTGFYLTLSIDGGATTFIPDNYSIETADTFMTVRCYDIETSTQEVILSIYCGDGTFVHSVRIV